MEEKKTPMPFKKEKLSPEAVDHFVEKHNVRGDDLGFPYTTQTGEQLYFSPRDVIAKNDFPHFAYLLSQTYPYGSTIPQYNIKNLAYLYTGEDHHITTWSTNSKVLQQFTQLIVHLGYGYYTKSEEGLCIIKNVNLKPIIHKERTPEAPGE